MKKNRLKENLTRQVKMDFENLDRESVLLLKEIIREKFEVLIQNKLLVRLLLQRPDLLKKYEPRFRDVLAERMIEDFGAFLRELP